jgi:hypothetical protein
MSNNWVKNVACKSSGAISYGDCRWGINFPGGVMDQSGGYDVNYETNSTLQISASQFTPQDGFSYAEGYSEIRFYANGVMRLQASTTAGPTNYHKTWLTSGSAGDYTVQFQQTSGDALDGGSSAANTDLAMSTDRLFALFTGIVGTGAGFVSKNTLGNIIIKDGGGTLITRPIELSTLAEVAL